MDFIINHSGFFLGIGITALLALIGYYADKKDSNKKTNNSSIPTAKDELSSDNKKDVSTNLVDWMDESLPQSGKFINYVDLNSAPLGSDSMAGQSSENDVSVDIPNNNVDNDINKADEVDLSIAKQDNSAVSDSVNNVLSDNIVSDASDTPVKQENTISFNVNDFENINLSLEDLEKKNYSDFNESNAFDDSENYYYSNLEEPNSIDNREVVESASTDLNNMVDDSVSAEKLENVEDNTGVINNEFNNDVTVDELNPTEEDVSHEFDNEVQGDDTYEEVNAPVPEIFGGSESEVTQTVDLPSENLVTDGPVVDPSNDSFDDIWKF